MTSEQTEFFTKYTVADNHLESTEDNMFEAYGQQLEYVARYHLMHPRKVWTVVEHDDNDGDSITNGLSFVNRLGFFITKEDGHVGEEYAEKWQLT